MRDETKQRVWKILYDFAVKHQPKLSGQSSASIRLSFPFHRLALSDDAIRAAQRERSVVTSMGSALYPALAKAIGEDKYTQVYLEYVVEGVVNDAACNMIEQIVTELRTPKKRRATPREPNHEAELSDVVGSPGGGQTLRAITADLYIGDFESGPLFIELKTPKPNLDIAAESKKKMLYFQLIMQRRGIRGAQAFLGFTYNPYVSRDKYKHALTKRIMDMNTEVLMGQEMWDMIGGPGTYEELLGLIEDVRTEFPPS